MGYPQINFWAFGFSEKQIAFKDLAPEHQRKAQIEHERCAKAPGWNPKLVKLEGDLHMVDTCGESWRDEPGTITSVAVINYRDAPFPEGFPSNAPRAAKAVFKKEVRLRMLRSAEYFETAKIIEAAESAWDNYCKTSKGEYQCLK